MDENNISFGITFNDSHRFDNDGAQYFIQFFITNKKFNRPLTIDSNMIVEFSYTNELNYLCLTGYLDIIDSMQEIGKIFSRPFSHLQVVFQKLTSLNKLSSEDKFTFSHAFIITNIEIKDRIKNSIMYRLHLISTMWYRLVGKVMYSTWNQIGTDGVWINPNEATPLKIIQNMLKIGFDGFDLQPSLEGEDKDIIDSTSFDEINKEMNSNPIKFVTAQNTLMESINYLMNSQPLLVDDISKFKMNFIIFDTYENKYKIVKIDDRQTMIETAFGYVSDKGGMAEKFIYNSKLNFGSVVKKSILNMFKTLFGQYIFKSEKDKIVTDLTQMNSNSLISSRSGEKSLSISYYNLISKFDNEFIETFNEVFKTSNDMNYNRVFSNIEVNGLYKELFDDFVNQDSLILNISGKINRQPGQLFVVISDDSFERTLDVNKSSQNKKKDLDKNGNIVGVFFVSKVQKIIRPAQSETSHFTENIVLSRLENCIVKE